MEFDETFKGKVRHIVFLTNVPKLDMVTKCESEKAFIYKEII